MAFGYNKANLATATLAAAINTSATSITVDDGSVFPSTNFYATLMPANDVSNENNSEIVLCTARSSNTLTVTRAQRGTTARSFDTGAIIVNGIYTQDLDYAQSVGKTVFNTSYNNGLYTVSSNADMLPNTPDTGMRITIKVTTDSAGTPGLDLTGGGSVYNIYTGSNVSGDNTHDAAVLEAGETYELVFDGAKWIVTNQSPLVVTGNIDWSTILTLTTTDPGAGSQLAANTFIGVYEA